MSKFKVGDRVRLTEDNGGYGKKGDTGKLIAYDGTDFLMEFDREIYDSTNWYVDGDDLELLTPAIKIGDTVTGEGYYTGKLRTGVVVVIDDDSFHIRDEDGNVMSIKAATVTPTTPSSAHIINRLNQYGAPGNYLGGIYCSRECAEDAAADYAQNQPGARFAVFSLVSTSVADVAPVRVERAA